MKTASLFLTLLALFLTSCLDSGKSGNQSSSGNSEPPIVHAINYPLFYFAQRIGGEHIDLRYIVPLEVDPAFWEPSEDQIPNIQGAEVILLNGATYAKWRAHVSLPESATVDTSAGFADQFIAVKGEETHSHGQDGDHSHSGTAFTTWIDFTQAKQQAASVLAALSEKVSESAKADLESNAQGLFADLEQLDAQMKTVAAAIGDQPLMASHPVYQYFARRYALKINEVLWEPETVPSDEAMAELQKTLGSHSAKWMIWEGEPAAESIAKLKAIGMESTVFSPCGNMPEEGDWLAVMKSNIENLKTIQ